MASNSTSRKKSKKVAEEVITLGSSDEEERENVNEGKRPKAPSTLEEFHDNVFAVARTFRSPFTPQQFSKKYKQLNHVDLSLKPFGYSTVREVLSATRDIFHEEDGTFFVYDDEYEQEKAKNNGLQKKGKGKKLPTTLEEFHESILAVARSFRSSFTISEFANVYTKTFSMVPSKEFGYSCVREALFSVKGLHEEDGVFIIVEDSLSSEEAFAIRRTRLKELQKKISKIFKELPETFSSIEFNNSYQRTCKEPIPLATVGFDKLAAFLAKHPDLEEVPGKEPRFKKKNCNRALKKLQDKVSAVARTLPEPFSCSVITDHYRWRYNEIFIPFESFGFTKLAEFCMNHPELEEVRGKCGDLLFKMKNCQKEKESSAVTEEERAVSTVSKRKHQEVIEEDLQPTERDSHEDPPKKKKRKDKEIEREQKEDENDHGEKQSKENKTDKVVFKKKHEKDKTVSGEESVETGRSEVAGGLQTIEGGEDPPKKKKKSKKRDEGGNANENDNRQNDHVEEQSKTIKTEKASSKKNEKVARVKENVEVKGNDRAEEQAVAESIEVLDVKPEKKEIGVNETTKNVNENVVTTEAQDPMLMTAPFPHQMPPMPMHFQPMMSFAPPPSRHAILGSFITQMLEHAQYRGQNADDIASKLLQVINDSNKPNG